ncbi:MAG: alkaline phosphatase D family protein [Pseudonocardia sp.]
MSTGCSPPIDAWPRTTPTWWWRSATIYEYGGDEIGAPVRRVAGGEAHTLADYRRRYAQYHADPDLRAAHAAAPWAVVFDDHEVANNWAGRTG